MTLLKALRRLRPRGPQSVHATAHYRARYSAGLAFETLDGTPLIDALDFSYSTAEVYHIREPLSDPKRIVLDRTDGLSPGDTILVTNNMYGGGALRTYQVVCSVRSVAGDAIGIDHRLPPHLLRYSNSLIVLKRSAVMRPAAGEARLEPADGGARLAFEITGEHLRVRCEAVMGDASPRIQFRATTTYLKPCRLFHQAFAIRSPLELSELYLKNRTVRDVGRGKPGHDVWLWKEGCRAGDRKAGWIVAHNPGLALAEVLTAGQGFACKTLPDVKRPTLVLNLEHYHAHHFRRQKEAVSEHFSLFQDHSLPAFDAGDTRSHAFDVFLGADLPAPPRLMLAPRGHRAVHVWTEHADKTTLASHRAAYYGDESITDPSDATGGFVKHGHVVTKSIFFENPGKYQNAIWVDGERMMADPSLAYADEPAFRDMVDELHARGHEVCLHTVAPDPIPPDAARRAVKEIAGKYASPTWIDHDMQRIKICLGSEGVMDSSEWGMNSTWKESGIRFFWTWSSPDFMPKKKDVIDLLHAGSGDYTPTPLYWRHPQVIGDAVIWAANECPLEAFTEETVDAFIRDRGVSVHQHYYPFLVCDKYSFGFIDRDENGRYAATPRFNEVLAMMASRRDAGELYITTVGDIVDYWLALEDIRLEMIPPDGFILENTGARKIEGMAFVVRSGGVTSDDVAIRSRPLDGGDTLVWFDMPANGRCAFCHQGPEAA